MGFSETKCRKALIETGNMGPDMAMNWLFEHAEDIEVDQNPVTNTGVDVSGLIEMGFTESHARKALKETNNDMERAVDWLFSHPDEGDTFEEPTAMEIDSKPADYELFAMISHKGPSANCGHYVSFVKKENKWVLFNDEKVAHLPSIEDAACEAYLYFYRRKSQ